jgi:predicted MPP superfamily phosphohydrolase
VSIVGVSPETFRTGAPTPHELIAPGATLRLLLCHYPDIARRIPPGSFDLILTGHLHAGQICLPLVGRRVALAHPRATLIAGRYDTPAGTMHVSPGTGTTFVPFRFFARPEVTELVLRRSD